MSKSLFYSPKNSLFKKVFTFSRESILRGNNGPSKIVHNLNIILGYFTRKGYFKSLFPRRLFCGVQMWFIIHRLTMMIVPVLTLLGFLAIFYYKEWSWVSTAKRMHFTHSIIGACVLVFSFIQVKTL